MRNILLKLKEVATEAPSKTVKYIRKFTKINLIQNKNYLLLITFFIAVLSISSRLTISGYVYNLDYKLFQPDGGNYLKFTKDILDFKINESTVYAWTRPLYPLLSVPFYYLLGKYGMLAIPILSVVMIGFILQLIGKNIKQKFIALIIFAILTSSSTFMRWNVADLTDSLHLLLFAYCCLLIMNDSKLIPLLIVAFLGSITRPMGPIWAALFLVHANNKKNSEKKYFYLLFLLALIFFVLNFLIMAKYNGIGTNPRSLSEQILGFPFKFFSIFAVELGQIAVLDRILFYFVITSTFIAILNLKDVWSRAHLAVCLSSFFISAWIGVYGVNFRYQLPILITSAIVVMSNFKISLRFFDSTHQ